MCGLVGGIARRNVIPVLMDGLQRLEYRGYDSAGIATLNGSGLMLERTVGRVEVLARKLASDAVAGTLAIGHTRWATHGRPAQNNAHPQASHNKVAIVHNGIIENFESLREELQRRGYVFESDTDTEVIAHRIHYHLQRECSLLRAVQQTVAELEGAYAIGVISTDDSGRMVVARRGSPLLIGVGQGENFVASDVAALLPVTRRFIYLEEGDVAEITDTSVTVHDQSGQVVVRPLRESLLSIQALDKGDYAHYMLKEIFEQGRAIADTLLPNVAGGRVLESPFGDEASDVLARVQQLHIVACGTSYHAALVGSFIIESLARCPCRVERASEYRYRMPVVPPNTLFICISQSGETADTLAALRFAQRANYLATLAICNVDGSSVVRESDMCFMTQAGPEIGVASTKAFTTQLVALNLLAILMARCVGLTVERERALVNSLHDVIGAVDYVLEHSGDLQRLATGLADREHALFIGRGTMYPVAMEGALKLKEISYIHAEAYAAGELKHGPLALVDEHMPVIALAPSNTLLGKLKGNLQEVRARDGRLLLLTDAAASLSLRDGDIVVPMPSVDEFIAPIVYAVPLQLLAYYVAVLRGTDVDKPRNLAKSVTVE